MYKLYKEFKSNYNKKIIPDTLNPELDKELENEVNFFLKWGYLIIDKTFNKTFKKLKDSVILNDDGSLLKDHIHYNLFEYDKNFLFLLDNKPIIKRISAILGNCIQLHSAAARLTKPDT